MRGIDLEPSEGNDSPSLALSLFKRFYLFTFRERGREGEREGNIDVRNINWLPLAHTVTRDQTHSPGMCPDGESNQAPFSLWDNAQPTELH